MAKKAKKSSTSAYDPDPPDEEIEENGDEWEDEEDTKAPAPEEADDAENKEQEAGEPVNPPAGSHKITIEGEGELLLPVRGETRSIPRGVEVDVGDDIMTTLEGSSINFKRAKK